MGTTIRREPITSKIPASEDYKYLNITEFRGIDKSSNPFTQSYNTASEALNVYVDETNALTTRPRLQKFVEITQLDEIISVHNISNGFLIQGKKNNNWKLYIKTTSSITEVTGSTINAKITGVFEQDDKIYFVNGVNYYVINNNVVSAVEGYIPTIKVGKTLLTNGNNFESPNLLSDKYKESYYWDGTWNPGDLKRADTDSIENKAKKTTYTGNYSMKTLFRTLESGKVLYESANDTNALRLFGIEGSSSQVLLTPSTMPSHTRVFGDCDANCENYVYYYYTNETSSSSIDGGICAYKNSEWLDVLKNNESDFIMTPITEDSQHVIRCDYKCDVIAFCYHNSSDNKYYADVYKYNNGSYSQVLHKGYTSQIDINLSRNGNTLIVHYVNSVNNVNYGVFDIYTNLLTSTVITLTQQTIRGASRTAISYDGSKIFIYSTCKLFEIVNGVLTEVNLPQNIIENLSFVQYADFSVDTDNLYILSEMYTEGWICLNNYTDAVFVEERISSYSTISSSYTTSTKIILGNVVNASTHMFITIEYDLSAKEPLLEITHTINNTDDFYKEWNQNRNVKNSKLTTRFNNERWFAKSNKTFHTQYNDPTYIPVSSYNINGDLDEITAMNVISDSILGLYKKDDLWLVNLTTDSNGDVVYYYNENNNVVGNDAFNAAITTIYSNLPIQITYDGVYTIQQQSNVAAPDRLAKSLSDGISDMWLKENKNSIANAQTLNRLYWTYIILPTYDESTNEQLNNTKVYLLDNRTLSWYYWELPTTIVSSFVKDNKVYLADKNGFISTLETSDITKILSENASISEYYDFDEQIINWYWQSQILPLGTINYSKKLVNTTFIVTDTDENDGYSIQYQFNVFRRAMGETNVKNITNKLNYVQSVTKKTFISRFNFIQIKLFNMDEDLDNNKLRLVGLGLKYVLLEGML